MHRDPEPGITSRSRLEILDLVVRPSEKTTTPIGQAVENRAGNCSSAEAQVCLRVSGEWHFRVGQRREPVTESVRLDQRAEVPAAAIRSRLQSSVAPNRTGSAGVPRAMLREASIR